MRNLIKRILSTIINWKESLLSIPLVITIWALSPYILTNPDDVNAPAGWGVIYLQKVLFAIAMVFVASTTAWLAMKVHKSKVFKFSNEENKEQLTEWQKDLLVYLYFALFSLVFAVSLNSL